METRRYKNTDEKISLLGFGGMRLPLLYDGKADIDYKAAGRLVDIAIENGINYFDTAYPYHDGDSEGFFKEALKKHPREKYKLADKLPVWAVKSPQDVLKFFNEQLEKCGVDYFDFYLVHCLTAANYAICEENDVHSILSGLKKQGKIRHLGFSFHDTPSLLRRIINDHKWDFTQLQINYYDWEYQNAKLQYNMIEQEGIPCIVMEPVRGGTLAVLCEKSAAVFKAADPESSIASWAIRYAASLPGVITVLSGMSNEQQLYDNINTMKKFKPLNDGEYAVIEKALGKFLASDTVPCTGCRYCMDCPSGVDIPKVFKVYNDLAVSADYGRFDKAYSGIAQSARADSCIDCKICTGHCPQHIDIPAQMRKIDGLAINR